MLRAEDAAALLALKERIERTEPAERRRAWSALLAEAASQQARERLRSPVARLEQALGSSPWVGPRYTIADIDTFALTLCLPSLLPEAVSQQSIPQLMGFLARMHERPAVQAALAMSRAGRPGEAFVPGPEPSRWG